VSADYEINPRRNAVFGGLWKQDEFFRSAAARN
jgi:hypothetical protein